VSSDFTKRYEAAFWCGQSECVCRLQLRRRPAAQRRRACGAQEGEAGHARIRDALRVSLEGVKNIVGTHGVYNLSASNHNGLDERARVLVRVENGEWRLMK